MRWMGIALGLLSTALRAQGECAKITPMERAAVISSGLGVGFDLLRIQPPGKTALCSPTVLESLLLALQQAAGGSTRRELLQIIPGNVKPRVLGCLLREWQQPGTTPNEPASGLQVQLASKMWVQPGIELEPAFVEMLQQDLGGELETLDLTDRNALSTLNAWVAEQTGQTIGHLFTPEMVNRMTRLVLASTALFKGKWSLPFDVSKSAEAPFYPTKGEAIPCKMMHLQAFLPYAERPEEQIVLLPIQGQEQRWAFMVVLPTRRSAYELSRDLQSDGWSQWLASTQSRYVELSLPQLRLRQRINLAQALPEIGIKQLFTTRADLSRLSSDPTLFVGSAATETILEVNESGLMASAAAGAAIRTLALREPPDKLVMVVDRPFLFGIVDRQTGSLLFVGRCEHPESRD